MKFGSTQARINCLQEYPEKNYMTCHYNELTLVAVKLSLILIWMLVTVFLFLTSTCVWTKGVRPVERTWETSLGMSASYSEPKKTWSRLGGVFTFSL